jgi:hypothetical protein
MILAKLLGLTVEIQDKMLADQLAVMQKAYASMNISFRLMGTTRTVNKSWAIDGNPTAMKRALRQGSYKALNIYFEQSLGQDLGYCYFPTTVTSKNDAFYQDGCSILYSTVPGGSLTNYNLGHTVTHEVGHWFGLFHPFEGGNCTGPGDYVDDTPAELTPTSGCPTSKDSCPSQPGLDPIHNFMDYSTE